MTDAVAARSDRDLRDTALGERELRARLSKTWSTASGLIGALSTVDHKIIGRRYIVTVFKQRAPGMTLDREVSPNVGDDGRGQAATA